MFDSDWERGPKVALIAFAFALVAIFLASIYQAGLADGIRDHAEKSATRYYAKNADNQIRETCTSRRTQSYAECVTNVVKRAEEEKRAEANLTAQTNMAQWAKWMFWATVATFSITGAGVVFLYQDIRQNRRIGEAQIRAYLFVGNYDVVRETLPSESLKIVPQLANSGQSPAFVSRVVEMAAFVENDGSIHERKAKGEAHPFTLAAGESIGLSIVRISDADINWMVWDDVAFVICTEVLFHDVFADTRNHKAEKIETIVRSIRATKLVDGLTAEETDKSLHISVTRCEPMEAKVRAEIEAYRKQQAT